MKRELKNKNFLGENLFVADLLEKDIQKSLETEKALPNIEETTDKYPAEADQPTIIVLPEEPHKSTLDKISSFVEKYKWVIIVLSFIFWLYTYGKEISKISSKLKVS